ncbi:hypothetical protein PsorP6_011982 [Peronosclerospora sorghi]|uniref:Uncharacterized protein n=1 Tax=Peronosclerospora sorghi TaxID=230839 RepID=A0ACC0WKV8_9STRA|nr:hypothetical protein PsorP6_011982 [Peronosclerospora sorghi]
MHDITQDEYAYHWFLNPDFHSWLAETLRIEDSNLDMLHMVTYLFLLTFVKDLGRPFARIALLIDSAMHQEESKALATKLEQVQFSVWADYADTVQEAGSMFFHLPRIGLVHHDA